MPYIIKKFGNRGYKVCKRLDTNKCFSNKPITLQNAQKQLKAIGISESKTGGATKIFNSFIEQLKDINFKPEVYLNVVKKIAKSKGYNPDKLTFSNNPKKKLNYDGVDFGAVNYGDFIIWSFLELNNEVEDGYAKIKRKNYRKRAIDIMKKTKDKYSPASLSFYLLW